MPNRFDCLFVCFNCVKNLPSVQKQVCRWSLLRDVWSSCWLCWRPSLWWPSAWGCSPLFPKNNRYSPRSVRFYPNMLKKISELGVGHTACVTCVEQLDVNFSAHIKIRRGRCKTALGKLLTCIIVSMSRLYLKMSKGESGGCVCVCVCVSHPRWVHRWGYNCSIAPLASCIYLYLMNESTFLFITEMTNKQWQMQLIIL